MANRARGETTIEVPNVGSVTLCLTLAGMAELEDHFEVDNIQEAIGKVQESPSSRNMAVVIHALMAGTENADAYTVDDVRKWAITPAGIREAMSAMTAGADDEPADAEGNGNRAQRRAAAAKK